MREENIHGYGFGVRCSDIMYIIQRILNRLLRLPYFHHFTNLFLIQNKYEANTD